MTRRVWREVGWLAVTAACLTVPVAAVWASPGVVIR